jgi:hypothetical protein
MGDVSHVPDWASIFKGNGLDHLGTSFSFNIAERFVHHENSSDWPGLMETSCSDSGLPAAR